MFDISTISKRYFSIKINDIEIEVEPPKIKTLKKIITLSKNHGEDAINELSEAVKIILSKNKTGYQVPDEIIDEIDLDQYNAILIEYFKWISEVKNSPN